MNFSKLEMSAIVKMAKAMALADGVIDPKEKIMMANELERFDVPSSDVRTILEIGDSMQPSEAASVINAMNAEQKKYVAAYLGTMIAIDGDIDDTELVLWRFTSTICNLPTMSIAEAIAFMSNMD